MRCNETSMQAATPCGINYKSTRKKDRVCYLLVIYSRVDSILKKVAEFH